MTTVNRPFVEFAVMVAQVSEECVLKELDRTKMRN
uniref:Uncharacterized protein n=1 Tax=Anguilla anguilla TaxID=7936 RepID=A0A0E9PRV3_ANGAN